MINQLATISNLQVKKNDVDLSRLHSLTQEHRISHGDLVDIIQHELDYLVLHNIAVNNGVNTLYRVCGKDLLKFLIDYIESDEGDGIDMKVFPESLHWCLSFDIDGSIRLKD